ncbi:carbohydrate transporter [Citrobacter koseri]|nr:carbohydrate transporter [Citrobacter koseri]
MSQTSSNPATLRLPFKEKLAYGMGDLGSNILLDIGTLYLLKFYTDVLGLPGTYGGIIFLIAKFFTAFTDMGTGIMLDSRRKIGPKGKFRPFVLYAAFPVTLLAIANFIGTPFEITGKTVDGDGAVYAVRPVLQHDELFVWRDGARHYQKPG